LKHLADQKQRRNCLEKILDIIDSIAHEKGLDPDKVRETLKKAYVKTAQRIISDKYTFEAVLDEDNKKIDLFQKIEVVDDEDDRLFGEEEAHYIALCEAKEIDDGLDIGDEVTYEITLDAFGRTAAVTLHNEIEYHIQRLVEDSVFEKYQSKIGALISGAVVRIDAQENTYIEIDEMRAVLPKRFRIKGESFKVGDVIRTIVKNVYINKRDGMQIILSRTSPKFLEELLRLEVPEIADGNVVIHGSARIPGERAKVALYSTRENIDPVGATVGVKGVRINAVSQEILGESIDVINYSTIPEIFLSRAMSPAIVNSVTIKDEKAIISINSDQKAKAIGKQGINIRLASMLTDLEIELKEIEGSKKTLASDDASDTKPTQEVQNEPMLSSLFSDD